MTKVHFLHTSDWQLGMTRHYLSAEAQARFTADRIDAIRRIGAVARGCGASFIVVAGDVFEHANLPRAAVTRALDAMAETGVPIYLLPGNHDPLDAASIYRSEHFQAARPDSVHVLDRLGPFPVADGVEILAAPWFGKHPESDPVAGALAGVVADGTVRILVGHGMLAGVTFSDDQSEGEVRPEPLLDALDAGLVHYVALGDRHIAWPDDPHQPIQYSGTPESTSFREPGRGQVLEVVLADDQLSLTRHEVGRWQHLELRRELNADADLDELDAYLTALPRKECTIIKHALRGALNLHQSARLDDLLARHAEVFASLTAWQRHSDLVVVPDEAEFELLPVGGFLRSAVQGLRDDSQAGDLDAAEALKLLYRLSAPTPVGGAR